MTFRALLRVVALLLLAVPAGLPMSGGLAAQGRSLRLESFHADIVVRPDGHIVVTETLRPRFTGSWNGVYRNLSLQHETARGLPKRLRVEILSTTDGEGNDLRVDRETPDAWTRRLKIWVPGARDATTTVVLRYRVDNAIRYFGRESDPGGVHDELYWNVTGSQWEIPIDRASAEVTLPPGTSVTEAYAYTGPQGSTARDATVTAEGPRVEAAARNPFSPGEGLTVSVSWPPGAVARPPAVARAAEEVRLFWPAGLPVVTLVLMVGLWVRRGRDPRRRAVVVQYDPPEDLSPAEVGTLVDHRAEMHDLTSTLVDLAVRGYLRIEERVEKRFFGLKRDRGYVFHLLSPRPEWGALKSHERRFLDALFGGRSGAETRAADLGKVLGRLFGRRGARREEEERLDVRAFVGSGGVSGEPASAGASASAAAANPAAPEPRGREPLESVELSDLENRFYRSLGGIRNGIYDRLVERGHYRRRPDRVKGFFTALAVGLLVAGGAAMGMTEGAPVFVAHPLALLAGFGLSGGVVFLVGLVMPARTVRGARTREAALGFKEFLTKVEEPRYRRMIRSPEDFERFLPYAMAFRVEDRWAKAFEDLYREPPTWYAGSDPTRGFRTSDFTSRLGSMTHQASSTFSSSPSGSGGGGSSGGGSGGGGGGGF
ncbi:MAG TPA: DUF2207 domain-containing protein [Longimicrobiales bacterium]|nr:DUF2207 domain-containing protein [Longimicrobiales bacterium]